MTIRVTQQYVDVFGPVSGKLRVSRQYVEVLHQAASVILTGNAASTLSLTQVARGFVGEQNTSSVLGISDSATAVQVRLVSPSSVLGISDQAGAVRHFPVSASSILGLNDSAAKSVTTVATGTLSLIQIAHGFVENQDADSVLGISDLATTAQVYLVSGSSVLGISDQAAAFQVYLVSASSTLGLNDLAAKSVTTVATSTISFISNASCSNIVGDRKISESLLVFNQLAVASGLTRGSSDLGLSDVASFQGPTQLSIHTYVWFTDSSKSLNKYLTATNTLSIRHTSGFPISSSVNHSLNLIDLATITFITDVLNINHSVDVGKWPGIQHQTIPFIQTVIQHGTFRRTVAESLGIGHSLTYLDDTPCNRKQYTPFMGDNTVPNSNVAPLAEIPNSQYTGADRFLLYYPARGVRTTSVDIRAPEFGDRDRNAYNRINRESRGGYLTVYADPIWPKIRTLVLTFTGLKKADVDDIQNLFYAHLGQLIGITDWHGREWEGVITDPNQPAIQDGKSAWTVTFTFEGEVVVGHSPGNRIEAVDTQTFAKDPGANSALILAQELGGAESGIDKESDINFQQTAAGIVV